MTRTEEKKVLETRSGKEGTRKEEQTVTVKKDGSKISESKTIKEQKIPGAGSRFVQKALKDANDNTIEVKFKKDASKKPAAKEGSKGAGAAVDLKAEVAKRRQSKLFTLIIVARGPVRLFCRVSIMNPV